MANIMERQPGEVSLLSQYRVSDTSPERMTLGTYCKPAQEMEVGDLLIIAANGEKVVALVSGVFNSHMEISSTLCVCNVIMEDGTLGRDRQVRKTNAGFLDCFMPDWMPSWTDIEYDQLK